jgi:hypothetical protein
MEMKTIPNDTNISFPSIKRYEMIYKHYKGNLYEIICEGYLESNAQKMVICKRENSNKIWIRPYEEFYGKVEINGKQVPRFLELMG